MKTINIYGENKFEKYDKIREASRGIVISDEKILLTYEVKTDQWSVPGGGTETGEEREACCIREVAEETGCIVQPRVHFLTINEYYEDWLFISHYYICECIGETTRHLTSREIEVGLEPRRLTFQDAIQIFSKHQEYAKDDEMKRGNYLREYEALTCFENIKNNIRKSETISQVVYGTPNSIDSWMELVKEVSCSFPGLETPEKIEEHKKTVLRFMDKKQALCVKQEDKVIGVLLFSRNQNMICCLAVSPLHRKFGIATALLQRGLDELDRTKNIAVSIFREDDEKGIAPRALYGKFGFVEDELTEEFGYPNQRFILRP